MGKGWESCAGTRKYCRVFAGARLWCSLRCRQQSRTETLVGTPRWYTMFRKSCRGRHCHGRRGTEAAAAALAGGRGMPAMGCTSSPVQEGECDEDVCGYELHAHQPVALRVACHKVGVDHLQQVQRCARR